MSAAKLCLVVCGYDVVNYVGMFGTSVYYVMSRNFSALIL